MAYKRNKWEDEVLEHPHRYKETDNGDGTITHVKEPGEIIEPGTPVNATNLNNIEEGLQHTNIAFDLYYATSQAQMRDLEARLALAEAKLATLP